MVRGTYRANSVVVRLSLSADRVGSLVVSEEGVAHHGASNEGVDGTEDLGEL